MKKILKIALLVILGLFIITTFVFLWNKSNEPKSNSYTIVSGKTSTIENKTLVTGKIEPRDEILIKPQLSGIISEILVEAGESVKAGDVIAKIKVIPDMMQLNSAETRLNISKIAFEQEKENFSRNEKLYAKGVISKEEFEMSQSTFKKLKEDYENAKDALEIVRSGVSKRTANISTTHVRATINGTILEVPVKVGNSVIQSNTFNDGTTIASIADMSNMLFVGNIDETEVNNIYPGTPVKIIIGAMNKKSFDASLEYVSPKGNDRNGAVLFQIKAAIKIPAEENIRSGYSANAEIVLNRADSVLTIPENALNFDEDKKFVYILVSKEEPILFEKREVITGLSNGVDVEIKSGITKEDKIGVGTNIPSTKISENNKNNKK